jgi:hypothetical protein
LQGLSGGNQGHDAHYHKMQFGQRFWTETRGMLDMKLPELHQTTWTRDIHFEQN